MIPPDNPVWQALSSYQSHLNSGSSRVKIFPHDISPFVGIASWDEEGLLYLMQELPAGRNFSVMVAARVNLPDTLDIVFSCPLYQMWCINPVNAQQEAHKIRPLDYGDVNQMLELTQKTKPGPFFEKTIEMGKYYGIFDNEKLAAMAGERLRFAGFTEISAICTDPAYLGRGYASVLTMHVAHTIQAEGNIPFLHVKTDNTRAIDVYRRAGFAIRTEVYFAIFRKR